MSSQPESARRLDRVIGETEPLLRVIPARVTTDRASPNAWSICELLGHLIDSASNNHQRFVRAIWQDDLVFIGYDQDHWVTAQQYQASDWQELITLWASLNRHLVRVMACVPEPVRTRVHQRHNLDAVAFRAPKSVDEATLAYFMTDYVDHLEHHLRQVFART